MGRALPLLLAAALALPGAAPADPPVAFKEVRKATQWLLSAQNRDGSWGLDSRTSPDISCTVIASLALMAAGNTERGGPDPQCVRAVRRGLAYVQKQARGMRANIHRGTTTLIQHKLGANIHTFFAAVFLSQVYGMRADWVAKEDMEELREHIDKLIHVIVRTQEADGSWHKETFGSLKATCMAWLALRSAASAGLNVEDASVQKTIKFIKSQYNPRNGLFDRSRQGGYQSIYSTASCLRVLYGMGEGDSKEAVGATKAFMNFVQKGQMGKAFLTVEGEDYLSAALVTQALLNARDGRWAAWFPWIQGELIKRQNKDGSWTSTACITGKTFPTASALLALQAPFRLLPLAEI